MENYTYIGIGIQQGDISKYTIIPEKSNIINAQDASKIKIDIELINESISRILNTKAWNPSNDTGGERWAELDFGSRLSEIPFEPNDMTTVSLTKQYIIEALGRWEPRITIIDVLVQQDIDNHKIMATIFYAVVLNNNIIQVEVQTKLLQ